RLEIERLHDSRIDGWHSGDIHTEYLSPHAALLEGMAEDLAVVNLQARATTVRPIDDLPYVSIPNIFAFSGQRPCLERPGHMVVVNTLNWHEKLGQLLLLNCHRVVYPLYFGTRADDWTLADWCDQCHRKGGLVISQGNSAFAELILGKVDAYEPEGL